MPSHRHHSIRYGVAVSRRGPVALSLAINRDQIRESVFLGLGENRQAVPASRHPYKRMTLSRKGLFRSGEFR
jgi:hypothetical protein